MSPVSKIPPSPPNPSIAMSGSMESSLRMDLPIPFGISDTPDPKLTFSVMPVDTLYSRQWNVMPWAEILDVDYPYSAITQFSITYFSADAVSPGDTATLSVPGLYKNVIGSAPVTSIQGPISFVNGRFYLARVTFFNVSLPSPDVILNIPNKLIFPKDKTEFHLRFNTDPVIEDPSLLKK